MASLFPSCHCKHSLPCSFSVPNVHVFRADRLALDIQSCALPWRGPPLPFPVLLHHKMLILKIVFLFVCLCACVCVCVFPCKYMLSVCRCLQRPREGFVCGQVVRRCSVWVLETEGRSPARAVDSLNHRARCPVSFAF